MMPTPVAGQIWRLSDGYLLLVHEEDVISIAGLKALYIAMSRSVSWKYKIVALSGIELRDFVVEEGTYIGSMDAFSDGLLKLEE